MSQRLDGRMEPAKLAGNGAEVGDVLVWDGNRWVPGSPGASLWVGTSAPTDGSVFWYDTDDTC